MSLSKIINFKSFNSIRLALAVNDEIRNSRLPCMTSIDYILLCKLCRDIVNNSYHIATDRPLNLYQPATSKDCLRSRFQVMDYQTTTYTTLINHTEYSHSWCIADAGSNFHVSDKSLNEQRFKWWACCHTVGPVSQFKFCSKWCTIKCLAIIIDHGTKEGLQKS